eukprot:520985-Amorphochlora_amoeboformis.AAC.2
MIPDLTTSVYHCALGSEVWKAVSKRTYSSQHHNAVVRVFKPLSAVQGYVQHHDVEIERPSSNKSPNYQTRFNPQPQPQAQAQAQAQ